jgi:hypothetical protein
MPWLSKKQEIMTLLQMGFKSFQCSAFSDVRGEIVEIGLACQINST